jgi:hypothetical protein
MKDLNPRSIAALNMLAAVILGILAAVSYWSTQVSQDFAAALNNGPDVAQTLYTAGRYELLRDNAVSCDKEFKKLVAGVMGHKSRTYYEISGFLIGAALLFLFNFFAMRRLSK